MGRKTRTIGAEAGRVPLSKAMFLYGASRIERLEVAQRLHAHSARSRAAFVEAQLTSIPQALREARLFGKEGEPGWVTKAQGGTLLIDELDCLTSDLQRRVADLLCGEHDIRMMVASRHDHIVLLRHAQLDERLHTWLETLKASQRMGPERIKAVRALSDGKGDIGLSSAFEPAMRSYVEAGLEAGGCSSLHAHVVEAVERPLISMVLHHTGGNQLRAASLLGVNRNTLRKRIHDLNISVPKGR